MRSTISFLLAIIAIVSCSKEGIDGDYRYGVTTEYTIASAHSYLDGESNLPSGYDVMAENGDWQSVRGISGKLAEGSYLTEEGKIAKRDDPEKYYVNGNIYVVKGKIGTKKVNLGMGKETWRNLYVISVISVTPDETSNDAVKFAHVPGLSFL